MTKDEAMKLALDALVRMESYGDVFLCRSHEQKPYDQVCEAITALREALDEPVQEPVAWEQFHSELGGPFYSPPRREWVSLTDEEVDGWTPEIHSVIRAIEAKLKEKNCA